MRGTLTIIHTRDAGSILDGANQGDGSAGILRHNHWRWNRELNGWHLHGSRGTPADTERLDITAQHLRVIGFQVTVDIDDTANTTDKRTQARQYRHEHTHTTANTALAAAAAAHARHIGTATPQLDPAKVAAQIAKLERELSVAERETAGGTHTFPGGYREIRPPAFGARLRQLDKKRFRLLDELHRWQEVRADLVRAGLAVDHGPATIRVGDRIEYRGKDCRVVRISPKSVLADSAGERIRVPYEQIVKHVPVELEVHAR